MGDFINIEIDNFTPCLNRAIDGEIVSTHTKIVDADDLPSQASKWEFDWQAQSSKSAEIIGLYADGDSRLQGLIGYTPSPEMQAVHVDLAESAPHNNMHNPIQARQAYTGVGPHLFAAAVKKSVELGYNGCIYFEAKTNLIAHYSKTLGAIRIGSSQRMIVEGEAARRLYETYYGIS